MAGLEQVYLRQAGTGSAALLGQSSWDPVAFAKYSTGLKAAQEAAKNQKNQKLQDDFFKSVKVKGGKVLADDFSYYQQGENDFYEWAAEEMKKSGGMTPEIYAKGQQMAAQIEGDYRRGAVHKEKVDNYHKLTINPMGGEHPVYDTNEMYKMEAIYTQPYQYMEDPEYGDMIQETWLPMFEEAMKDPLNARNPERTAKEVTLDWRDNYGDGFIGTPIYNPISLEKNFKDNVKPLLNEIKKYKSVRTADGTVITEENAYILQDDTQVEVEMQDGSKQTIIMPGVKTLVRDNYDTDVIVQRSAMQLFNKLPKDEKQQYIDEYGSQDAAKEWYINDKASSWGLQATSKNISQAPLLKSGTYRRGNKTYPFEVVRDEGEFNFNRLGVFSEIVDEKENKGIVFSYAKVPVQSLAFGSDANKYPKVKVNPLNIFNQDSYSWTNSDVSQEYDFTAAGVFRAPGLTQDVNIDDPRLAGFKEWAYKTYGAKANTAIAKIFADKAGVAQKYTPVSKAEADELNKAIPGLVDTQYYATGQISGYDQAKQKNIEIPAATIPLEQIQKRLMPATNDTDWKTEIDDEYGPEPDWWKKTVVVKGGKGNANSSEKKKEEAYDPNAKIKQQANEPKFLDEEDRQEWLKNNAK